MVLFVYVDYSNVWIEGMRVSAVKKGLAPSTGEAMRDRITDQTWRLDFGRLYSAVCPEDSQIGRSSLFGSRPPEDDSIWRVARERGFEVTVFDRNAFNKEKGVDMEMGAQILDDSYQHMRSERGDRLVLVSGDQDFLPVVRRLADRGIKTTAVFWDHAAATNLKTGVDAFAPLDPLFAYITH
ncbi:NYN domain-containing protein [Cellulomonas sp. PS-H5]|uniref:NYN domain-containing protein n=1 Tax=Cellulomonas sp. PS-H5 TaxID=2820400 RepID=UPI001C5022CD|nr:NYN domain-containing protein [Cellulomonas sp. PS-H5]MBW0252603.1 NYN domain-containing protein [Cellulomonas sp. PS-H5]